MNAIAERGWKPLNHNLLLNDELRATMTDKHKQAELCETSNIFVPKKHNPSDTSTSTVADASISQTTVTCPSTTIESIQNSINFSNGTAAFCIDALLSNQERMKARERIKQEETKGKSIKDIIKE